MTAGRRAGRALRRAIRVAGLGGAICASAVASADSTRSGEQVYRQVCATCHGTGYEKAPRLGDRSAWAPRLERGQDVLTAHAWVGVRSMPARGGRPDLALEEFARGAAHMARAAGAIWSDPDLPQLERIREEERKRLIALGIRAGPR